MTVHATKAECKGADPKTSGLTITRRLTLLVGLAAFALMVLLLISALEMHASLVDDRKIAVRNEVETAATLVRSFVARVKAGNIGLEEAQERAKAAMRDIRYGNGEYFFVFDFDGNLITHVRPDLEGTNMMNSKDSRGNLYVADAIRVARQGGGYISYDIPRAGETEPKPKLAYSVAIDEWSWELGTGVYVDDIDETFRTRFYWSAGLAFGLLSILTLCSWAIAQGLVRPLRRLTSAMRSLAAGHTSTLVPEAARTDEIGGMARAVEVFKKNMIEAEQLRGEQERQKSIASVERKRDLDRLAEEFEGAVGAVIETVSLSSIELEESAGSLMSTAARAEDLSTLVAAACEDASGNVHSVAAATEEMSSSIHEISRQVQESARIANDAVSRGKGLGRGDVKATGDISQQITGIQEVTNESVEAINGVSGIVARLAEIASAIAAAVEEQGAATREISRNVQQAAGGTHQVSTNVSQVQQGAVETKAASSRVFSAARSLASESSRLKQQVSCFLATIRAA